MVRVYFFILKDFDRINLQGSKKWFKVEGREDW